MPSAYSSSLQSPACGISFKYNSKKSGHKMDPWGTPHREFPGFEKVFLIWTLDFLFDR